MIALDLLGATPANTIDSSQNIYRTNPVVPDMNAAAPTSAVSYYQEAPGLVEDTREIDVNRVFNTNAYVPQWDAVEGLANMIGIDAFAATQHQRQYRRQAHRLSGACVQASESLVGEHARTKDCPPLTHCNDSWAVVGAAPTFDQLKPYFLTDYPSSAEELAALYWQYLKAFDHFTGSVRSVWHPLSTAAAWTSLQAARDLVVAEWKLSGTHAIIAVQMLAGLMGWFNANYVSSDGSIKWDALGTETNAGIIDGAQGAAQMVVDGARAAGQAIDDLAAKAAAAAKTAWWTMIALLVAGLGVAGLVLWKLLTSDSGKSIVAAYLPGRRR